MRRLGDSGEQGGARAVAIVHEGGWSGEPWPSGGGAAEGGPWGAGGVPIGGREGWGRLPSLGRTGPPFLVE